MEVCEAADRRTTEMPGIVQALKMFQGLFKGVRIYWEEKARHEKDAAGSGWRQALPPWCLIKLNTVLRQLMEGSVTRCFKTRACPPPPIWGHFASDVRWRFVARAGLEGGNGCVRRRIREVV